MLLQWSHCEWPPTHQQKGSESTQIIIQTGTSFKIHKRFLNFRNFSNVYSSLCLVFTRLFGFFFLSFLFFFFFFFFLWRCKSHGVAKSQTRLSDWTELKESPHILNANLSSDTLFSYSVHCFYSVDWFLCHVIILILCSLFCQNWPLLLDQWNRIQKQEIK